MTFAFQGRLFFLVATVNDGHIPFSQKIFSMSPVIQAQAVAEVERQQARHTDEVERQQAGGTGEVYINIRGTVHQLWTLEQYVLRATQNDHPQPGEKDLPTLIAVAEFTLELKIPGVAELVTSDINQVLVQGIHHKSPLRNYPWLKLCHLAKETNAKKFYDYIAWRFLNSIRATCSPKDALWAFQIGKTVHEETGYPRLLTYSLYLCVAWGAFSHPDAPELPRAMASAVPSCQTQLATLMNGLAIPQLCEVHDSSVCVGGDVRRRCVDAWKAVWQRAHQVARERLCGEYNRTNFGGVERDALRMFYLIALALQRIMQTEPVGPVSPMCDRQRLQVSRRWLLKNLDTVRAIINRLALTQE